VGFAPVSRDHGQDAGFFEKLQKISHHALLQERHVACGNEGEWVARGGEAGLDSGERSLTAGSFAADLRSSMQPDTATSHNENFLATASERVMCALDQGYPAHLEG
jgi:hypothetical protein